MAQIDVSSVYSFDHLHLCIVAAETLHICIVVAETSRDRQVSDVVSVKAGGQAKKLSDIRERDSSIKPQTCLGITKSKNGVRCAIPAWMSRTSKEMRMRAMVVIPRRRFV